MLGLGMDGVTSSNRSGAYCLDPTTLRLTDEKDTLVAQFIYEAIGDSGSQKPAKPLAGPAVRVVKGEIMKAMQDPANAGAYFVLPSQLNGAEYPHNDSIVTELGSYRWDRTAGPRGQLAVHPAMGQFLLDNAARLTDPGGINAVGDLLKALRQHDTEEAGDSQELAKCLSSFKLENGYLKVPEPPEETDAVLAAFEAHLSRLRLVAACDIPASGLTPDLKGWSDKEHRVNVIYASAVPADAYNNPAYGDPFIKRFQQAISSVLLRGQYYGCLRLALMRRRPASKPVLKRPAAQADAAAPEAAPEVAPPTKVFLLPVGGGVFNNSFDAIARSISEAVDMASELCPESQPIEQQLDIRLLAWEGRPIEASEFRQLVQELGKLRED